VNRGSAGRGFGDETAVLEALDGFVQRARAEPDRSPGAPLDILLDRIPVQVPLGKSEEDVDDGKGQGLSGGGVGTFGHKRIV